MLLVSSALTLMAGLCERCQTQKWVPIRFCSEEIEEFMRELAKHDSPGK